MAVTFAGNQPSEWGAKEGASGLTVVLSASATQKVDKKEIKGSSGDVECVAFFNKRFECSAEGYGVISGEAGATTTIAGVTCHIEELTQTWSNEDFVKSSIKGTAYPFA